MSSSDLVRQKSAVWRLWWVRGIFIGAGVAAWFWTQSLIRARPYTGVIGDGVLGFLSPVHDYLLFHVGAQTGF